MFFCRSENTLLRLYVVNKCVYIYIDATVYIGNRYVYYIVSNL